MRQFINFDKSLFPANFIDDCDLKLQAFVYFLAIRIDSRLDSRKCGGFGANSVDNCDNAVIWDQRFKFIFVTNVLPWLTDVRLYSKKMLCDFRAKTEDFNFNFQLFFFFNNVHCTLC
jgi:hypothetical protein